MKFFFYYKTQKIIFILKPLVKLNRNIIKKWILLFKIPIVIDRTNRFIFYRRNRIRFFLFPFLKYFFKIEIELKLFNLLKLTIDEFYYFQKMSTNLFFLIYLKKNIYLLMPNILQKKFIKKMLKYSKKSFTYKEIEFININLFKNSNVNFVQTNL